jgi:M6 family metalloprotease-like protein
MMNRSLHTIVILLLLLAAGAAPASVPFDEDLAARRAAQRAAVREAARAAAKSEGGATFGLLVIPVDFSDARLPAGWLPTEDLGPRLEGEGQTLARYFATASGGACDLRITLAPLVSLAGARRDYSDLEGNILYGRPASRRLATEAVAAVAATGFPLRRADNDGPDRTAGTADDDGEVDGVLILHAGIGLENDIENGLIEPLQYFLDDPVEQDGVRASSYAVAALGSGLGIWAHETGHLLGLDERYDLRYSAGGESEVHSRGGLGRFSLMAAGAWGTGHGREPALLDAYSLVSLGWCPVIDVPAEGEVRTVVAAPAAGGAVHRVWTHGRPASEYFLLEVRQPVGGFDAAVPAGQLVIYHVDETMPESALVVPDHLRVRLVEADGDGALEAGLDEGGLDDLFPGALGRDRFTPDSTPDSDGYGGASAVRITGIAPIDGSQRAEVACTISAADAPAVLVDLGFGAGSPAQMQLAVTSVGQELAAPSCTVYVTIPAHGAFAGGATSVDVPLVEIVPGRWVPEEPIFYEVDGDLPAGAADRFIVRVGEGAWDAPAVFRTWPWDADTGVLDFSPWPGGWSIDHPGGRNVVTWHRWDDRSPAVQEEGAHVLACAALADSTGETWPDVSYDNAGHAVLTSAPLPANLTAVRMIHAWDTEALVAAEFMDGALAEWVGPDGGAVPAVPVDGWPGRIDPRSLAELHGRAAWGGPGDLGPAGEPVWRTDILPLPADGEGPWRLRLSFATNTRGWDWRGWLIRSIEPLAGEVPATALPLAWDGAALSWTWPFAPAPDAVFTLEAATADGWRVLDQPWCRPALPDEPCEVSAETLLPLLPALPRHRSALRIVGPVADSGQGLLASGAVVVFPDGGDGDPVIFGRPWPNPAVGAVQVLVGVPDGAAARLDVYDLAGRLVHRQQCPPGEYLVRWDGRDRDGRRVAAGTYVMRLDGPDGIRSHKVVLLH